MSDLRKLQNLAVLTSDNRQPAGDIVGRLTGITAEAALLMYLNPE